MQDRSSLPEDVRRLLAELEGRASKVYTAAEQNFLHDWRAYLAVPPEVEAEPSPEPVLVEEYEEQVLVPSPEDTEPPKKVRGRSKKS